MRNTLVAVAALAMLAGCGNDSTGPDDTGNPNPDPQHYTISVSGDTFDPDTIEALVGDWIHWHIAASDTGEHQIDFIDIPVGAQTTPTDTMAAGGEDSVSFLVEGTYKYQDQIEQDGGGQGQGVLIISPLP